MRIERQHVVRADRLDELCHVAQRDRVTLLRAAILAAIRQERHAGGHARGAAVLEACDEKQQATEPVVRAARLVAAQRLDDEHVGAADADQRSSLVLAALELALFHRGEAHARRRRHTRAERPAGLWSENQRSVH